MTTISQFAQQPLSLNAPKMLKWILSGIAIILMLYLIWSLCCIGCELFNLAAGQA